MIYWTLKEAEGELLGLLADPNQKIFSENELARCNKMKIEKRKKEWVLGRMTAKTLLSSDGLPYAGQSMSSILIDNQPEGAPYLPNAIVAGSLSISHREDIAVAAYTSLQSTHLGIDLEKIEPREMSFVEDFFTEAEADYTMQLTGEAQTVWVTLVWSAKEAVLKAWQKGLRLDTRSIEIHPIDPNLLITKPPTWQPMRWQANIAGYPRCWLGWQRLNDFILTLAYTTLEAKNPADSLEIHRVDLKNFPIT